MRFGNSNENQYVVAKFEKFCVKAIEIGMDRTLLVLFIYLITKNTVTFKNTLYQLQSVDY